ncbi:MAG TPA: bifunctional DNA-formamidopyrimidine glycosylase/DNA-(apurinic or apyrimidinic site) lyase [bacterium]|nr:bifunctional DNA-formamidopyrimidine glycosylase/DNA-(apurinic or apyrimidinic site) lyase [bacterium]
MPELPEVETIRNGLSRFVLNREINTFIINDKKLNLSLSGLKKLRGDSIIKIDRLGKMLIFSFKNNDLKLLVHLKMTGQLIFCLDDRKKSNGKPMTSTQVLVAGGHSSNKLTNISGDDLKYIRFQIIFSDAYRLVLNDARRFAYIKLVSPVVFSIIQKRFGLEPLSSDFSFKKLVSLIKKRYKKNIKAFLLDQSLIAGIGNIYADEIMFASKINPYKKAGDLNLSKQRELYSNIKRILRLAVKKRGTTFNTYVDAQGHSGQFIKLLKVYGRAGAKCYNCGRIIKKIKIAGRGTCYCPKCQI